MSLCRVCVSLCRVCVSLCGVCVSLCRVCVSSVWGVHTYTSPPLCGVCSEYLSVYGMRCVYVILSIYVQYVMCVSVRTYMNV